MYNFVSHRGILARSFHSTRTTDTFTYDVGALLSISYNQKELSQLADFAVIKSIGDNFSSPLFLFSRAGGVIWRMLILHA